MEREEKLKALDAALTQIERQYGKGAVMKLGDPSAQMNVETIPTGSLSLDIALGLGGIPKGRIIEIYGPESSGKTTVTLFFHMIADNRHNLIAIDSLTLLIYRKKSVSITIKSQSYIGFFIYYSCL